MKVIKKIPKGRRSNKILIIAATHGNEPVGLDIMEYLESELDLDREKVEFVIGNPRAYLANKRFLDVDLNRVYPGNKKSKNYEDRRAADIYSFAKKYKYVIDIHQTVHGQENLIIVPSPEIPDENLLSKINIKKIILWPSTSSNKTGPLAQFISNGVELEIATFGLSYNLVVKNAANLIFDFIKNIDQPGYQPCQQTKFLVYGKLLIGEVSKSRKLQEFKRTQINQEIFYPLLVNTYLDKGIICYKMKK